MAACDGRVGSGNGGRSVRSVPLCNATSCTIFMAGCMFLTVMVAAGVDGDGGVDGIGYGVLSPPDTDLCGVRAQL